MIYLLDSNTLIEAKNRYYRMTICPGYWAWIRRSHAQGVLASIESVADELKRGNDELAHWAKQSASLFLQVSDTPTQACPSSRTCGNPNPRHESWCVKRVFGWCRPLAYRQGHDIARKRGGNPRAIESAIAAQIHYPQCLPTLWRAIHRHLCSIGQNPSPICFDGKLVIACARSGATWKSSPPPWTQHYACKRLLKLQIDGN